MLLLGPLAFHKTEAARLLRLARAQSVDIPPIEELLARHRRLVRSGFGLRALDLSQILEQTGAGEVEHAGAIARRKNLGQ